MNTQQILFIFCGAITLAAALMVVTRRNVLQAALFLVIVFIGTAGLYALLNAPVLAAAQLFTYVGGIAASIALVTLFTQEASYPDVPGANRQWVAAALVALGLCGALVWVTLNHTWGDAPRLAQSDSIAQLGKALVDPEGFLLPLGVNAVLMLVAIFGALTITRER